MRGPSGAPLRCAVLAAVLLVASPGSGWAGEAAPAWLSPHGEVQAGADGQSRFLYQPEFRPAPWLAGQLAQHGLEGLGVAQVTPEVAVAPPAGAREAPPPVAGRLLLTGTPARIAQARALLARLDVAPRAVFVSILMTEVNCAERESTGGSMYFDKGAGPNPENTVFRGGATTFEPDDFLRSTLTGVAPFEGTSLRFGDMDVSGGAFEYTLRMLARRGDAEFLAWPSMLVNEGGSGLMSSLEAVPQYLVESTNGATTTTTVMEQTGLKLRVTPTSIGAESAVLDLDVWLRLPEEIDDGTASPGTLRLRVRQVRTRILVRDRESLMIGGIILRNAARSRRGFPRPRELELFDPLHSAKLRTAESTEIVFLVRARIVVPSSHESQAHR